MRSTRSKATRLEFYDPLYEFITFEEAAQPRVRQFLDPGFGRKSVSTHGESISPHNEAKVILPFLSTVEFTRQSFLRQSNLAFLVYPSATHTRLAHSIGSCYLGFLAAQRVSVRKGLFGKETNDSKAGTGTAPRPVEYLSKFLEETAWREEFYLALLLHDAGHYPFSHALENNNELWSTVGGLIEHEAGACQLIQGKGPIYEASLRRTADVSPAIRKGLPHLSQLFGQFPEIKIGAICYLISGDVGYIHGMSSRRRAQLRAIHALVSGLLDLDRVDHYRRDNFFTGLRGGTGLNFPGLLSGLTICYDAEDPEANPQLCLSPEAVGHAISLLQSKERLIEDCFEHPHNVAYEVMLHHSFNMFVFGDDFYESPKKPPPDEKTMAKVHDLLVSTDDELLYRMRHGESRPVKDIVFRIVNRDPYHLVGRMNFPYEHRYSLSEIRTAFSSLANLDKGEVVLRPTRGFGERDLAYRTEWLNLDRLRHSDGRLLVNGPYRRQINHFKEPHDPAADPLWVYATTQSKADKMMKVLSHIRDKFDCKQ